MGIAVDDSSEGVEDVEALEGFEGRVFRLTTPVAATASNHPVQ
jgi:hypothetical protein